MWEAGLELVRRGDGVLGGGGWGQDSGERSFSGAGCHPPGTGLGPVGAGLEASGGRC